MKSCIVSYLVSGDVPHISSLHIVNMDLFVGLLNGKLLMVDLLTMSPLAVFHCHEDRVKPIFSLQVLTSVHSVRVVFACDDIQVV